MARVMDQELCRTRGQRKDRISKIVHVLYYGETYEEEKMRRVLAELIGMRMYEKYQKYILSGTWSKWLKKRPALSMLEYLSGVT